MDLSRSGSKSLSEGLPWSPSPGPSRCRAMSDPRASGSQPSHGRDTRPGREEIARTPAPILPRVSLLKGHNTLEPLRPPPRPSPPTPQASRPLRKKHKLKKRLSDPSPSRPSSPFSRPPVRVRVRIRVRVRRLRAASSVRRLQACWRQPLKLLLLRAVQGPPVRVLRRERSGAQRRNRQSFARLHADAPELQRLQLSGGFHHLHGSPGEKRRNSAATAGFPRGPWRRASTAHTAPLPGSA